MAVFVRGILLPRCPWAAFLSSARDFTSRYYKIGDEAEIRRVISIEDVQAFAHFSGDTNPIHLDENFAKKTRFGAVIVHGVILNGYVGCPGRRSSHLHVLSDLFGLSTRHQWHCVLIMCMVLHSPISFTLIMCMYAHVQTLKGREGQKKN